MNKMTAAIILVLVSIVANALPVNAQQTTLAIGNWDAIKSLPSKEELTVSHKDGTQKKGKLTDVTDNNLIMSQGKKIVEIRREDIFQIYRTVPKSRDRATGIGAGAGAGLGLVAGLFGDGSSGHGSSPGMVVAGVLITAGVGALIGRGIAGGHERVLIYEARK